MADETVTLAGVLMTRDGFIRPVDLSPLLGVGQMRGANLLVESEDGRVAKGRRQDEWSLLLQFYLFGKVAHDGTAHADGVRVGLRDNLEYLRGQHLTGAEIAIVHTFPDASTRTGTCTVESIDTTPHDGPQLGRVLRLTYDLTVAAGSLT